MNDDRLPARPAAVVQRLLLICEDERQYVGWHGQQWTTMAEIAGGHTVVVRNEEADLVGIGVEPSFAIGQRALLVNTPHGNVLWDRISLLDEQVADAAAARSTGRGRPGLTLAEVAGDRS